MKGIQPAQDSLPAFLGMRHVTVQLGSVAGRDNQGFIHLRDPNQVLQRCVQVLVTYGHKLPHLYRRGGVVNAECE